VNSFNKHHFSENVIRPSKLESKQRELEKRDYKRLLSKRDQFVDVKCPACSYEDKSPEIKKYGVQFYRCNNCDTLYLTPRPTPEILDDYLQYSENYEFWNKYVFPQSEDARRIKLFKPRVERVIKICRSHNMRSKNLMEVGAGFGTFCEEIKAKAFFDQIIAVEPTPSLAKSCRKKGLNVIEKSISDVHFDKETIDVIVSFEVIEHLFDPSSFIRTCYDMLSSNGILILTCPNYNGFDFQILGTLTKSIDLEHLNYFNPKSLSFLLETNGFEVLEIDTPGKLDAELVRQEVLAGCFSLDNQPFLKRILIDEWDTCGINFQQFLAENLMSSHMWLVARRLK